MSALELGAMPERMLCEQDIDDTLDAFARAANEYIRARLPFDDKRGRLRFFFITSGDLRYVSDHQQEQAKKLLGVDPAHTIVPQALINELRQLRDAASVLPDKCARPESHLNASGHCSDCWALRRVRALVPPVTT